jgi:anti-sigma factor (TIGR02949 family)
LLTCKEFLHELNQFLDEAVSAESRAELEKHVNECPNCFVIVDTTKKTLKVFKGVTEKALPADVHSRLMQALEKRMAAKGCKRADPGPAHQT